MSIPEFEIGDLVVYDYKFHSGEGHRFTDELGVVVGIKKINGSLPLYEIKWAKSRLKKLEPLLFSPFQLKLIAKSRFKK